MNTLVVVAGPTAVGKTEMCIGLAQRLGTPIINADSRQMFREMSIGTATPTADELARVRHHFVATLGLDDYYNAAMFERDALRLIESLFASQQGNPHCLRPDIALMSGGSMMYIDAVCNGIDDIPTITEQTRESVRQRLASEGLEALCRELQKLDPDYYDIVDRKNTRRVVHAVEICTQTGRSYTSFRQRAAKPRPFSVVKIALQRPREELYDRINRRVDQMMARGLLDEARRLYPRRHLNALNTVGYKELFAHLDGQLTLEEAVERIKGNTRRYARKQLTWLKRDPKVIWFNADDTAKITEHICQL